jgi:glycogen operon protein
MSEENWHDGNARAIAVFLNGQGLHAVNSEGEKVIDDNFYIIFNAAENPVEYKLPGAQYAKQWSLVIDTAQSEQGESKSFKADEVLKIDGRSVILLQCVLIHGEKKH